MDNDNDDEIYGLDQDLDFIRSVWGKALTFAGVRPKTDGDGDLFFYRNGHLHIVTLTEQWWSDDDPVLGYFEVVLHLGDFQMRQPFRLWLLFNEFDMEVPGARLYRLASGTVCIRCGFWFSDITQLARHVSLLLSKMDPLPKRVLEIGKDLMPVW